ncbi:hypothetical protein RWE15_02985 [Virgibacillus halophilus]|uniref:Uncharacterized protein n=1 Tax=Tigheibacillus halophilus TaxID=361280 RepID=A0ABU5C2Q2_9BACI|nr:hypothetical protein [Virgibacillus halophilus]
MKQFLYTIGLTAIIISIIIMGAKGLDPIKEESAEVKPEVKAEDIAKPKEKNWVAAWTASLQAPFEDGVSSEGFQDQTLRFIVKPHTDGKEIRIRLSNIFGSQSLQLDDVHVAISKDGAENVSGTEKQVTFDGDKKSDHTKGQTIL